jgi:hypothetical protein
LDSTCCSDDKTEGSSCCSSESNNCCSKTESNTAEKALTHHKTPNKNRVQEYATVALIALSAVLISRIALRFYK